MAGLAAILDGIDPLRLALHVGRHLVALVACARKFVRRGNLEQRIPVHARIKLRRRGSGSRRLHAEIHELAGTRIEVRTVGQAIATNPDVVICIGQIGDDITTLVVRHHDLGIFGRQVPCLGNDPDARLGPLFTHHLPADVMGGDVDCRSQRCAAVQQGQCACAGHPSLELHVSRPSHHAGCPALSRCSLLSAPIVGRGR
jgi:hypothetical protein